MLIEDMCECRSALKMLDIGCGLESEGPFFIPKVHTVVLFAVDVVDATAFKAMEDTSALLRCMVVIRIVEWRFDDFIDDK